MNISKLEKLATTLPKIADLVWNKETKEHDDIEHPCPFLIHDSKLLVSCESGIYTGDYYGEFTGGYPIVCEALEAWAKDNNGYWEWENPGAICFAI